MAKNAKKPPVNHDKPITAFFTRASKAPSSHDAHSPAAKKGSSANLEVTGTKNSSSLENASKPTTRAQSTRARSADAQAVLMSPLSASSLKRSLSPDIQPSKSSTQKAVQDVKPRQRSKFDSNSESESNGVVVYVKATPNNYRRKKARLSSPEGHSRSETGKLIPSSQSDEDELFRLGAEPVTPKNGSDYPQKSSFPSTPNANYDGMDVDEDLFSNKQLPSGSASSTSKSIIQKSSSPFDQTRTPPVSDPLPLPPTPVALDAASKSAKIIAEIKARAYANSMSSPEAAPFEFNDELESSSDEDDLLTLPNIVPKSNSKPQTANHRDTSTIATRRPTRYTLRNCPPSPSADGARAIASTSRPPLQKPKSQSSKKPAKKLTVAADPFAVLLKEKKLAEKRGNNDDAFRRAEITVGKFSRDVRESEMEEDFEDDTPELTQDDAIRLATENPSWLTSKLVTPDSIQNRRAKLPVRQEDGQRLFESGGGGTILDILEHDKAIKRQDELSEKIAGIHLWCAFDQEMIIDQRSTSYRFPDKTPILSLLNTSLKSGDFHRAKTLLGMDFMTIVDVAERRMTAAALYDLAFSDLFPLLHGAAVLALNSLWGAANQQSVNTVSFSQTLEIVQSLGADQTILSALNWQLDKSIFPRNVDTANREALIQRLVMLVSTCARSRIIALKDAPDFVLLLLLVGMDLTASAILMREVAEAIDLICHGMSPGDSISTDAELSLCSRIAACASRYEPVNKARLVSLLASGSGPTRRIANFVAYCVITDQENPHQKTYSDAPPLHGIVARLIPNPKATSGKFAIHEGTDYVDLGFYITILGVAVSNIRTYVSREREIKKVKVSESPTRGGEKSKSLLQLLHSALETLHSNIADTRATHLERSRAKAGIKGLAMNIHYQREIWLRNDAPVKATTLAQYFKKTTKT
ncbi:hypothetical protein M413DRAFT_446218 [Hebeloma cylindrosporum]|uniref:Uncharacterized protein n=1 Tax=Hebeloma cylindrosporum TaxID=76867 RepID=A0A0C3BTS4_HEBCY|nr:hypothetical protein M413DRAFT_446218 [Hebeloma cylindrosporum h7]